MTDPSDFTEQGEELAREQIVHAITDIQEARLSHLHWAEHFEAHPEAEKQYESTGEWDNAKVHREWIEKYDNVLAILARFPFAYLVSNDFTERAQTIVHEWITLDRNEKQVPVLIDRIASALAEAATQGQATLWRLIETAPKDGTRILVYMPDSENVLSVYWDNEFTFRFDELAAKLPTYQGHYEGAWTDDAVRSWGDQEKESYNPTHWMPLPLPPIASIGDDKE